MSNNISGGGGCGCVSIILFILVMMALIWGLPINGKLLEIDLFPPAIKFEDK